MLVALLCAWGACAGAQEHGQTVLSRTNLLYYPAGQDRVAPVRSVEDWQRRRQSIVAAMQEVMGPFPAARPRGPADIELLEETDCGSYLRSVFTAVFDDRIRVVVTSCGLDSFRDYMGGRIRGWTSERYMPRLLDYSPDRYPFDFHEVIAALAPRPCLISAPKGDSNFQWWSVDAVAAAAAPVYRLYGRSDRLQVEHPEVGHVFPVEMRERAYQLFNRHLN